MVEAPVSVSASNSELAQSRDRLVSAMDSSEGFVSLERGIGAKNPQLAARWRAQMRAALSSVVEVLEHRVAEEARAIKKTLAKDGPPNDSEIVSRAGRVAQTWIALDTEVSEEEDGFVKAALEYAHACLVSALG